MPDNQLAYLDQALFDGHMATGQREIMQAVWVYEHPVDFDGMRRVFVNLGKGLMGRLIEQSPLPLGRHRWVSDRGPSDIDIAATPRPRAELSDWADERIQLPIDAERGPGWHFGVQPLTDGSTAVSLVVSHYVVDGVGLFVSLFEAAMGVERDLGYPPPRSHSRLRAAVQDARQTARDMPDVWRALLGAAKMGREYWRHDGQPRAPKPEPANPYGGGEDAAHPETLDADTLDGPFLVPWLSMQVPLDQWEARARALGGTSTTLAAAVTAKLGERIGRHRVSDGNITLLVLESLRTENDTRALALSYPRVVVDPTGLTTDLSDLRAAVKQALQTGRETADDSSRFAPLTLLAPKRLLKRMVEASLVEPDRPVVYSHLGDTPPGTRGVDGTDAEYVTARGAKQQLTRRWLNRTGGLAMMVSARFPDKMCLTFQAYQPGADNTKGALRDLVARTLADFGLTANIE
jgi:hypothetical protein